MSGIGAKIEAAREQVSVFAFLCVIAMKITTEYCIVGEQDC